MTGTQNHTAFATRRAIDPVTAAAMGTAECNEMDEPR
jgi:hypothetical protein